MNPSASPPRLPGLSSYVAYLWNWCDGNYRPVKPMEWFFGREKTQEKGSGGFFHLRDRTVLPVSAGTRSVFGAVVFFLRLPPLFLRGTIRRLI